ncbi:hypothetical protein [Meridianimarinicoccus aquatilis]|uniref:Uncharacterized protein n=1 Tax=Meridianimarinicoccus aquatilis TaxID=2552766 RepID=A0A4V3BCE1_9RHOB|nr:hypothetical protein [Fluviibacterium aquatile]QIE41267.1 hypothetical protein G5B39_04445 [Rhodobacteraceae bacterium SC52]TDL90609.1 hypothetical protein E2L05_04830 [Fluviibacterium aquatile]
MDRTELIIATGILLFGAFLLGFLTHWLVSRLSHVSSSQLGELEAMAEALHYAEETRDAAMAERVSVETRLQAQVTQAEAELRAAMEGLREARHDSEALRAELARLGHTH